VLLLDDSYVFSATDLSGFLACEHLLALNRRAASGTLERPADTGGLAAHYGNEYEQGYLAGLKQRGLRVAELDRPESYSREGLSAAHAETQAALAEGYDVVYQATLFDGTWLGHPDFLFRRDGTTGTWAHSYDVVDTKLARHAKATALVQVALYGEMLAVEQGCEPQQLILALGDGSKESFAYRSVAAYLRAIKSRFLSALDTPPPYPYPVEHCDICIWSGHCDEQRHRDDHLSLVAGIRRQQAIRLEGVGIATLEDLATHALPLPSVRIGSGTLDRLRRQAVEQYQSRLDKGLSFSLLPSAAGIGLATMPEPDPGDIFFDLEGFPYAEEGGLEYLFGWVDAGGSFDHLFAEDRGGEKRAFEAFMDVLQERLAQFPGMHVYHYANYERSALSRLSNRHGAREEEVADLLRRGVLVDLYRVVRQSLVAGTESYSIKYLEPFYGLERTGEVKNAAESLEMYQAWLDSSPRDDTIREAIALYNAADCRSSLALRDWLLGLGGKAELVAPEPIGPLAAQTQSTPGDRFASWLAEAEATAARLLEDVPDDPARRDAFQHGRAVLAHLLKFHQREDNVQWRDRFDRLELSVEELRDNDSVAVADLRFEGTGDRVKLSQDYVYSFPAQDLGLRVGDRPIDPATRKSPGQLVELEALTEEDPGRGRLVLRRGASRQDPHPEALIPSGPIENYVMRYALLRLAGWVVEHGLDSPASDWRAARQLLLRQPPRLADCTLPGDLCRPEEHGSDALLRLAPLLDGAALPVQGPPGSGKTYSAAEVILDAVGNGKRVGVTSNSHRVIEHLLISLVKQSSTPIRIAHRHGDGDEQVPGVVNLADNDKVLAVLDADEVDVVGGTAWLMSRDDMAGRLDLLVVDEAGQVSLANALASMEVTTDTLLVGDPAQLDQPIQASHPEGTDVSALAYVAAEATTMPTDLGLFLDRTRRMHPSICAFVSEVAYEGKLSGIEGLERQSVSARVDQSARPAREQLVGSGIRYLPVAHEGNRTASAEEVERVVRAVDELLGGTWTDAEGASHLLRAEDILVVTPYNAQIALLRARLPAGMEVGTVDKFQGREAPVVIYSMATSSTEDLPRDFEFLFSLNRLNVAVSRAQALAVLVCSPSLRAPRCRTTRQIRLVNALCRLIEYAEGAEQVIQTARTPDPDSLTGTIATREENG
jgi:uncharacterized protein